MIGYTFRNVGEALPMVVQAIDHFGTLRQTRGGEVKEFNDPVGITYQYPRERVLFSPERDANPFFHCMEALWMLAGRNDVGFVSTYVKRMKEYSNDGKTFHGAYGYRWRKHFGWDQLSLAVERLKKFENDRRTVIAMWDADCDLQQTNNAKDIPCNTHIYLGVRDDRLNMTVCCRSNDLIWGAMGANVVHMSMLQEYLATRIGVGMGSYTQFSNNLHAYTEVLAKVRSVKTDFDNYLGMNLVPLVERAGYFDEEVQDFCHGFRTKLSEPFLLLVALPMAEAWDMYKAGDTMGAVARATDIQADDWRKACVEWLQRRMNNG